MKDRRYRKTEGTILEVFFGEAGNNITMKKLAELAGLPRSTMYVHHHAIKEIIPDYERYVLLEYIINIKKKLKNPELKFLYLDLLLFIIRNRNIFEMFLKFGDREILVKMLEELKMVVGGSDRVFRIFVSEVIEIIFEWGREGFPEDELEKVLTDIMYLTNTAKERLGPLG